jgi:hypothetical protein
MLSKLLYLHGIYYNVIRQDPNDDALFNITNILTEKWQNIFLIILCSFSIDRMSNFLIDLPRPIVNIQRVISLPTTFTWCRYLTFVNMLKGIASASLHSATCYSCIYQISLLIPHIKAWLLHKKKQFKKHNKSSNVQKHKPIRKDVYGLKPKQKR